MSEEMKTALQNEVCVEIQRIMTTYREQKAEGDVGTPGGLEHMGDVWRLLGKWDATLSTEGDYS